MTSEDRLPQEFFDTVKRLTNAMLDAFKKEQGALEKFQPAITELVLKGWKIETIMSVVVLTINKTIEERQDMDADEKRYHKRVITTLMAKGHWVGGVEK